MDAEKIAREIVYGSPLSPMQAIREALRSAYASGYAAGRKCPIGLDDTPSICSAGSCPKCAFDRGYAAAREQAAEICLREWTTAKDCEAEGGMPVPMYAMACQDLEEAIRAMEPTND